MSWGEFYRLVKILSSDSGSQIAASIAEWEQPFSQTERLLADLYDLQHTSKAKRRPPPYPRPWLTKRTARLGRTTRTPEATRSLLRRFGPSQN